MTDSIRISNAKGLYLEGIRDGNMIEALDKYGALRGVTLAMKRLLRCHPWNPGGFDPP